MSSKRQLQKESTRKKIIETAYLVYSEQGFNATTATIAKEAGLSHGAIFVHFPSLDELMTCLIEEFGATLTLELHSLVETNKSMEELLRIYLEVLIKHEKFYSRLITERSRLPEEVRMTLANLQSLIAHHFNNVIEREIDKQTVKKIPVHMIFNTWMGLTHYYLLNKDLFSPDTPVLERYREDIISTFLELIKR
ncbi:MAG: transcriptional regulator, TetR family [Herbinix sp.]|jgi:AcrR family transcriptional regulator|nr:transcriptional regulator, TetR family [Herbinix sp.]